MVDFSKFLSTASDADKRQTADEVVSAFKEVGFVYLSGHGLPESTVQNVFRKVCSGPILRLFDHNGLSQSADFFNLTMDVKVSEANYHRSNDSLTSHIVSSCVGRSSCE